MTDDELDLLASAYVDGEATPDEVARVERDPDLLARVETFRATVVPTAAPTPPGLAEAQIAAAMAEFAGSSAPTPAADAEVGGDDEAGAPVVSLGERRAGRPGSRQPTAPPRRRTMPTWLPAAAALLVIGGGVVFAASGISGGDDDESAETATADFDASAQETEAAGDDGSGEATAADASRAAEAPTGADDAAAEEAMEEDAEAAQLTESEAMEDDDAMEDAVDEDEAMEEEDTDAAASDDEGSSGPAPTLFFDRVPTVEEIDAVALPPVEPEIELSFCGFELDAASFGELAGFVPSEVAGQPAELFVFEAPDGAEIRVLVDGDCLPIGS